MNLSQHYAFLTHIKPTVLYAVEQHWLAWPRSQPSEDAYALKRRKQKLDCMRRIRAERKVAQ